jgi:HEAT repeat protein
VADDPSTGAGTDLVGVIAAGHRGDAATARAGLASADPRVRSAALGALERCGALEQTDLTGALGDPDPGVRRRACDAAAVLAPHPGLDDALLATLGDPDPLVAEAACWALGEHGAASAGRSGALDALAALVRAHPDTRVREAAVAALGAIGDPAGLDAVLDALADRPTVRRRAVVALAAFEGERAAGALRAAAADRDWQVREVAEILLDEPAAGAGDDSDGDATPTS